LEFAETSEKFQTRLTQFPLFYEVATCHKPSDEVDVVMPLLHIREDMDSNIGQKTSYPY
jgi:hypothetical protein